jgi:DNA integrity scanning protein DisA with diadenylate cyclase activity
MLIYNVTVQVERSIADAWLQWLQQEHIPELMQTGCFVKYQVVKLVNDEETDTTTYAIQYFTESENELNTYLNEHASMFRQRGFDKWGNRFIAFRTIMEVIN